MKTKHLMLGLCAITIVGTLFLMPESALAQTFGGGSDLKGRVDGLTNGLLRLILPAVSVLGLIYAAVLAAVGDAAAKPRMVMIAVASVVGFMAPVIIGWLQSVSGV